MRSSPGAGALAVPGRRRSGMKKPKSDYAIQTVVNALRVLEAFEEGEELGVTELSRSLELHKNNVFRILATLQMKGYIEQGSDGTYRLGVRCFELGKAFGRFHGDLVRVATPVLDALVAETGETVHLGVLRDFEVVHLAGREASQLVRVGSRVGCRLPAHCIALGKILLGCGGEPTLGEYDRWLGAGAPARRTGATIVDRDKLFEHLGGVAVRGIAIDAGECDEGLFCAAGPVYDATGSLVAALSISVPAFRGPAGGLEDALGPPVVAACERLSALLGHSG